MNITLLSLSLLASGGGAVHAPEQASTSSMILEVTPAGEFLREQIAQGLTSPQLTQALTAPGALWTYADNGAAWIAGSVELGNVGTQVFTEFTLNNETTELFSVFDADPPTPVWVDGSSVGVEAHVAASAADADVHFAANQVYLGGDSLTRQTTVRKFTSSSGTPDWSYTFIPIISAGPKIAVSGDGSVLVAAIFNTNTSMVEIATFTPDSGTPASYTTFNAGTFGMRGFDLSEDGSTLYFSQGADLYIFDVVSGSIIFTTSIGASFDSHAISGDGSVFAYGSFNLVRIWEWNGATYTNTVTKTQAGQVYCAQLDLSADSSTLAYGWYFYNPGTAARIQALDVATGNVTMTHDMTGVSGLQNVVADIAISNDGGRFAVGMWGDEGGSTQELSLYSSTQDAPLASMNLAGSIFDVDISSDGQRCVGGGKAVHANTFGNGGSVIVLDGGGEDLTMRGSPRIGTTPNLEVYGPANKPAMLLSSHLPQSPPSVFPGIGTLYVNRPTLIFTGLGSTDGNGELTAPYPIANDAALVGTNQYLQVLLLNPRVLTTDWLKVTFLP